MTNRFSLSLLVLFASAASVQAGLTVTSLGNLGGWVGDPALATTLDPYANNLVSNGGGTTAVALTIRTTTAFTLDKLAILAAGGPTTGRFNIYPMPVGGTETDGFVNLGFSTSLIGGGAGLPFNFNGHPNETVLEFDLTGADQITLDPNTLYAFDFKPDDFDANTTADTWNFFVRRGLQFFPGVGNIYALDASTEPGISGSRFDVGPARRDAPLALFAPSQGQTVMWESFEDPGFLPVDDVNGGWGWRDFQGGGGAGSITTVGATDGTKAIEYTPGTVGGFDQGLTFKLQDLTEDLLRRAEAYQGFINNTHISFDVTWDESQWVPINAGDTTDAANFSEVSLSINYGAGGGFVDLDPDSDTGNPANPGIWNRLNYEGVHTRTITWDYSAILADIQDPNSPLAIDVTNGFLEFIISTNDGGNYQSPVSYIFDNFTFLTPAPDFPLGDFDEDFDVDGEDFLLWQRNPSVGNLADWEAGYGTQPTPPLQAGLSAVPEPAAAVLLMMAVSLGGLARGPRRSEY
jgi:hypothetical protein